MAPILIVDGYNIIGSWDELKGLKTISLGSARDQLISTLSAYYPWCWERIIIVFDGQRFAWDQFDGVEVVFTEGRETADTMIEKLAAGLSPYYRVEVATSDFAEFRAASNLGAMVLSAPALKERLEEQRSKYRSRLQDHTTSRGMMLNDLLHESVLDTLEKLRRQ
ncbi:MAG: NYN domain-containing protein [Firmicutes bacterium]|nr:NYN domain-containing protein [Bacillota bacterium]